MTKPKPTEDEVPPVIEGQLTVEEVVAETLAEQGKTEDDGGLVNETPDRPLSAAEVVARKLKGPR
jgi:hypothetical protein